MYDPGYLYRFNFGAGLAPEVDLTVWQWADEKRVLSDVASKEAGRYRTDRTPYMREVMELLSVCHPATDISLMKPTQIGGSEAANNFIGYIIDVAPGPTLYMLPTVELGEDHSKNRIAKMIEETPGLQEKVSAARAKGGGNSVLSKQFRGGALYIAGSNSGASYRNKSIRFLILDDVDGFVDDVDGEGNPIDLATRRTDTYGVRKKIFKVSTPTVKGASKIEAEYEASDMRRYQVPCPVCGAFQVLEWGGKDADFGIKFNTDDDGQVMDAWYQCRECHGRIEEAAKRLFLLGGQWVAERPRMRKAGFHLSGLLSPLGFVSWGQICQEFLEAHKNPLRLKVWKNTRLAETFELSAEQPEWEGLKSRCLPYDQLTVPGGGLFLTAGVDVQENRIAVIVRAWGVDEETWLIWWGELYGDTQTSGPWDQLEMVLSRAYPVAGGGAMQIIGAGVDTGYRTQEAYRFVRDFGRSAVAEMSPVFALKGANVAGKPIIGKPSIQEVDESGRTIKLGVQLWPVGTDAAKAQIYSRLKIENGPGAYHWYAGVQDDYFLQLTAEKLCLRFQKTGFPHYEWIKVRERNEALDCEVYALAAAYRAGMATVDWAALEGRKNSDENRARERQRRRESRESRRW